MTSKLVVNTIESDTGISSVSFASSISMSSTSKFHFSNAGIDIGADTNINRPAAGVLGFNVNGTEKVRIDTNGHIHGVGVVTATHFFGDGSNLTNLPSQVTINNASGNRVITSDGGTTLNGEGDLTFDGNQLYIDCNNYSEPILVNSTQASVRPTIRQTNDANANSGLTIQKRHSSLHPANYWYGDIQFQGWDGSGYHRAGLIECVAEGTPSNDNMPGQLRFSTNSGAASQTERFRITASGQLRLMDGNNVKMSVYNDGSLNHITSNNGKEIKVSCGNGDSNGIEFWDYTGTNKRCQIDGHGIKFNADTAQANALDDYEEGSFTLSATPSSSGTLTLNSSYNTGVYTRVGNLVHIQAYLSISGNNNATGYVQLSSLPFTVDSNQAQASGHVRAVQVVYLNGQYAYLPDGAGYYNAQLYCNEGQTWIRIYDLNDKGRRIDTIARHLSGGADLFLNFSYLAA